MEFDHRTWLARTNNTAAAENVPAPGKHTLTEEMPVERRAASPGTGPQVGASRTSISAPEAPEPLAPASSGAPPRPLQMLFGCRPAPTEDPAQAHAAAARGTATPATKLPYADRIQRAFGRHDISGVKAHTGEEAAASTREMGATAYATGDHVVLGPEADLHTVAHEAAHVVQQRGGVQLKGGVGETGDAYERQADEVADRVVRGESAEAVLPPGAAGSELAARSVQLSNRKAKMNLGNDEKPDKEKPEKRRTKKESKRQGGTSRESKRSKPTSTPSITNRGSVTEEDDFFLPAKQKDDFFLPTGEKDDFFLPMEKEEKTKKNETERREEEPQTDERIQGFRMRYPALELELVQDYKYFFIYRITTPDHPMLNREVLCEEQQLYTDFTYKDGVPQCSDYNSMLDPQLFSAGWNQGPRMQEHYVTIDCGYGVKTGSAPAVLKTNGLLGCVGFLLRSKGAGFLAHVKDRIGSPEQSELLRVWATKAVEEFTDRTGSPPDSLIITRNTELNMEQEAWDKYLQYLTPSNLAVTIRLGDSVYEKIESGGAKKEETWKLNVG